MQCQSCWPGWDHVLRSPTWLSRTKIWVILQRKTSRALVPTCNVLRHSFSDRPWASTLSIVIMPYPTVWSVQCSASVISGIASHFLFYIKGEHHLHPARLLCVYLFIYGLAISFAMQKWGCSIGEAAGDALFWTTFHFFGLFGSMIAYRTSFHPLRHFPGPPLARVSKFWHVVKNRNAKSHLLLHDLYREYGPFVRTG